MLHSFNLKLIFVFSLLCLWSSCGEKEHTERVDSNLEMAKELASIAADESDITLWHLNRKRAEFIDSKIVEMLRVNILGNIGFIYHAEFRILWVGEYLRFYNL